MEHGNETSMHRQDRPLHYRSLRAKISLYYIEEEKTPDDILYRPTAFTNLSVAQKKRPKIEV
jgi:hypothetical protein